MSSVVSQLSSLGCSAYRCQCLALGSRLLIGAPLCGTYPYLKISHLITDYLSSRSLNGALNGNVGIIKSIVAEITDPTNIPQVYAYMPIAWSFGGALG